MLEQICRGKTCYSLRNSLEIINNLLKDTNQHENMYKFIMFICLPRSVHSVEQVVAYAWLQPHVVKLNSSPATHDFTAPEDGSLGSV